MIQMSEKLLPSSRAAVGCEIQVLLETSLVGEELFRAGPLSNGPDPECESRVRYAFARLAGRRGTESKCARAPR